MTEIAEVRQQSDGGSAVDSFLDREAANESVRLLSKKSIDLAWVFADITEAEAWKKWKLKSFLEWVKTDIANPTDPAKQHIAVSYAFKLREIGVTFSDYRDEISELAQQRKVGVVVLLDLASKCKQGMPIEDAMAFLRDGTPIPEQYAELNASTDPESPRQVKTTIAKGDYDNFKKTLVLYAVVNGYGITEESLKALVLSNYSNLEHEFAHNENFAAYHTPHQRVVFADLIAQDKFYCRHCNKIPSEPTVHHILPQSVSGGDFGPRALLCWSPCHEQIQLEWAKYCKEWLNDENAVDRLTQEAVQYIQDHGNFDNYDFGECLTGIG